jgi:YVTN family beta-propeller protein
MRFICFVFLLLCLSGSFILADAPPTAPHTTLFNGWSLTPAGAQVRVGEVPLKLAISPDGTLVAAVCSGLHPALTMVDVRSRHTIATIPLPRTFNGLAFDAGGTHLYVTGGNSDDIHVFSIDRDKVTLSRTMTIDAEGAVGVADGAAARPRRRAANSSNFLAGIAIHPRTGKLYVCNESTSELWVIDPGSGKLLCTIRTGLHPHSVLFGATPEFLYVSNWGERSVSVIDSSSSKPLMKIQVGVRPNDMALSPDGRLFVACAGDNTVYVLESKSPQTEQDATEATPPPSSALEVISTSLYPQSPEGSTPDGVAVTPDGKVLFAANADNNDVAVVDISKRSASNLVGFVPVGWYPSSVAVVGKTLLVANAKGLSSFPSFPAKTDTTNSVAGTVFDKEFALFNSTVSFIEEPTAEELIDYTKQVRANSPYTPEEFKHAIDTSSSVIPATLGQACPIKHVLYIIRENRTYDQVFGDMTDSSGRPIGNGEKRICMFGEEITPNAHALAREFTLFDNLYCNSEVSVDGHSWCDGAIATDYRQRSWIISYTKHGQLRGNNEMNDPANGFLWDQCRRCGITFKCYGEGAKFVPTTNRGTWSDGRDTRRVDGFIADLHTAEKTGDFPQFMIMSLPEDHTKGTTPGAHTPQACVANNDQAIGKLVEAISHSKFWPTTAIFIIEDDAQNGPDHVDSHRTAGLVISPYTKRHALDSTPYTQVSMVRTMELILGLPPMTQYDAAATPMFNCFTTTPDLAPFTTVAPRTSLTATNNDKSFGAKASAKMDFDEVDEAPEGELNRVLWGATMGNAPYPAPVHRVLFTR